MKTPAAAVALSAMLLLIVFGGVLLGLRPWFPETIDPNAAGIQKMLDFTLLVTGGFFVVGHLVLVWLLLRRAKLGSTARPSRQWLVSFLPALGMALAAEGGVIALGLPVFGRYYGAAPPDALRVEVTGRQFFWVARYPGPDGIFGRVDPALITTDSPIGLDLADPAAKDDIVVLNELRVPVGRPTQLTLRSRDVIHSFSVRELRLKQDAMPGMGIAVWFNPEREGSYEVACNQICGLGHYRMRAMLHVVSDAELQGWLAEQAEAL